MQAIWSHPRIRPSLIGAVTHSASSTANRLDQQTSSRPCDRSTYAPVPTTRSGSAASSTNFQSQNEEPTVGDTRFGSLMNELGVWPDLQTSIEGALSGARVVPVRHRAGTPAVLKLTTETDGDARQAAERELRFYRELQGSIGIGAPRLLAHREDDDFIAIVLTRHAAPRSATRWSQQNWIELAIDLATLHETPVGTDRGWGCTSSLTGLPDAPDLEVARAFWSWPGEPDLIEPILGDLQALHEAIRQPERCFLHGDCHSDNVLIERDQLIWVDWQNAGLGDPASELAFPSVRATPSGAAPPIREIVRTYADHRGLDLATLHQAVVAAELAIFLVSWPPYAAYNNDAGIQRVHQRVHDLAATWLTSR